MSSRLLAGVLAALFGAAVLPAMAGAAEPVPKPSPAADLKKPQRSCGELPRGSRAYSDCLAAQSRRDAVAPGGVQPVLSSR